MRDDPVSLSLMGACRIKPGRDTKRCADSAKAVLTTYMSSVWKTAGAPAKFMNAIYVGENTPELCYGQTGDYCPEFFHAFLPDGDEANVQVVDAKEIYISGVDKQLCKGKSKQ